MKPVHSNSTGRTPPRWVIDRPQTLRVARGQIWLTIEGEAGDHWLDVGASIELRPYTTIWVSGSVDASWVSVASDSGHAGTRSLSDLARAWFGRRQQAGRIAGYEV